MGTKPSTSVIDPRGRVWGTEGLYVADAVRIAPSCDHASRRSLSLPLLQSSMPTASGVNPMITVRCLRAAVSINRADADGPSHLTQAMSMSHSIAQFIGEDLRNEATKETRASL